MKQKGFSLVELMVLVAVFSVAAAILIPRFIKYQIKTRQAECYRQLNSLFQLEKDYFLQNNTYTENLSVLGWKPEEKGRYQYRFLPIPTPSKGFLFGCLGNIDKDPTLDEATIDETGQINQLTDDAKK